MREIKFRAWDGKRMFHQGTSFGFELGDEDHPLVIRVYSSDGEIDLIGLPNAKLMQYTGLKDKNGKEIYEGDVLFAHLNGVKYVVKHGEYDHVNIDDEPSPNCYGWYAHGKSGYRNIEESLDESNIHFEVIGNIHENPELLEESE